MFTSMFQISPGSDDSNHSDSIQYYAGSYSQSSTPSYSDSFDSQSSVNDPLKRESRRLKNRESAARSRKKIKDKLDSLEEEVSMLKEKRDANFNNLLLIQKEIGKMEGRAKFGSQGSYQGCQVTSSLLTDQIYYQQSRA